MNLSNRFFQTFILFCAVFFSTTVFAQSEFFIKADLRSRFEYRHGFGSLFPDDAKPGAFVTQRSRLNLGYKQNRFRLFLGLQDVSTWGDTRQILPRDGNDSYFVHQAWGQVFLSDRWSAKVGRQVLSYDDQRVMGALDWAMQGRFHDAVVIKHTQDSFTLDVGLAFNQERPTSLFTSYPILGAFSYKTMQYIHMHKDWKGFGMSFLFLNNGFQKFAGQNLPDGVYWRQTAGTHLTLPMDKLKIDASAYFQFGESAPGTDLSAYQFSVAGLYKTENIHWGLGFEMLSGTEAGESNKNNSFTPIYGTNHKFNGYMDYFFVGNHANNVGLNDLHVKAKFLVNDKSSMLAKIHYFMANAELPNSSDNYLGTEIDLVYSRNIVKNVKLGVGYSHMFAAEGMSRIKDGRSHDNTNNWAWVQLTFNPTILSIKKD